MSEKKDEDSGVIPFACEDCGKVIHEGETYFFEDKKVRCPECYEVYRKLKESKRTEVTKFEDYL